MSLTKGELPKALALGLSVGICEGGLPGAYTYDNLELSSTRITALIALADKVSKSFGGRTLYSQATLQLNAGERWALVGPNGSGKTTFLKIFMGLEPADEGTVTFAKETTVGYLEQETKLAGKKTALAEVVDSAQEVKRYERLVSELEQKISSAEPGPELDRLLEQYGHAQDRFERLGGFELESRARQILSGLGFPV